MVNFGENIRIHRCLRKGTAPRVRVLDRFSTGQDGWLLATGLVAFCAGAAAIALLYRMRGPQARLDQEHKLLTTAVNNISQGLCMFDASGRMALCNERFMQMYRFAPGQIGPGSTIREIIEGYYKNGVFAGDAEDYVAGVRRERERARP